MTKREIITKLLHSITIGDSSVAKKWVSENYIRHNPNTNNGLAAFVKTIEAIPNESAKTTIKILRIIEDGNYVAVHGLYNLGEGSGDLVGFEIFRFENDKIVEQWDNFIGVKGPNLSGHTQIDGPTSVTDLHKTAQNKQTVLDSQVALGKGDIATAKKLLHPQYIQHNPDAGDGLLGLQQGLGVMAKRGEALKLGKIHHVIGEGNLVMITTEGFLGEKPAAIFDLFRLENDQLVEHWDVIALELDKSKITWANNPNGKF